MSAPTKEIIHRVECQLAREGRLPHPIGSSEAYHAACRELGRRGGLARARRRNAMRHLQLPAHDFATASLPPRDRD